MIGILTLNGEKMDTRPMHRHDDELPRQGPADNK